jgi:hypothetical protein
VLRIRSLSTRGVAQPGSALAWGASGRRFKSCRPDSEAPGSTRESGGPGASSFPGSNGLTTGSPSGEPDRSPASLISAALAAIDGGVIRIGDLRALLLAALEALEEPERGGGA